MFSAYLVSFYRVGPYWRNLFHSLSTIGETPSLELTSILHDGQGTATPCGTEISDDISVDTEFSTELRTPENVDGSETAVDAAVDAHGTILWGASHGAKGT